MPEDMLGKIFGEEEERPEVEAPQALAVAEAFASAVAAIASRQDPGVARKTETFLDHQSRLLKIQADHLKDEHALRLAGLREQAIDGRLRRTSARIRIASQLVVALIAGALAIFLLLAVSDAIGSRSVVIDPFETPASLQADGVTGKTAAAGLLDVLVGIQAATHANAKARALSNAWTNQIEIEVPETGVSIAQIERILRARFGHDQHIGGDLVRTPQGGLALTVRGAGIAPQTFTGPADGLGKLLTQAGEYVYGQSQPGLWAPYLTAHGRADEAIAFAKSAYVSADPADRPYLLNAWGNALTFKAADGAIQQALPLWREAVRLKPDYWTPYNNIMFALDGLGDEEGSVQVAEQMKRAAGGRPGRAPEIMYQNYDAAVGDLQTLRAETLVDMRAHGGIGTTASEVGAENLLLAGIEAQLHDADSAALRLQTTPVDPTSLTDVAAAAIARALLAQDRGDLQAAAGAWDDFAAAYAHPVVSAANPQQICAAAPAYQQTGQAVKADAALIPASKLTYVDCFRFHGDVLDLRGDWPGAQAWYAKTVKLAPSLPQGYYSWGLALARHGDLAGAAAQFRDANRKGPHWADPLKAWGDVLGRQGRWRAAVAKYDDAVRYAPAWTLLRQARAAAARRAGGLG